MLLRPEVWSCVFEHDHPHHLDLHDAPPEESPPLLDLDEFGWHTVVLPKGEQATKSGGASSFRSLLFVCSMGSGEVAALVAKGVSDAESAFKYIDADGGGPATTPRSEPQRTAELSPRRFRCSSTS